MTVTTVFAGANDGYLQSSSGTYSLANAGSSIAVDNTATILRVGQFIFGIYIVDMALISFDTSAIPDTDTVSAVTLDMWLTTDASDTDVTVRVKDYNWGSIVQASDWLSGVELAAMTSVANLNTSGIGAVGAYKTFTSAAGFLAAAGLKTGLVRLAVVSSRHQSEVTPGGNEFVEFASADTGGTANDPMLTITHAPTPSRPIYQSSPNRIWRIQ